MCSSFPHVGTELQEHSVFFYIQHDMIRYFSNPGIKSNCAPSPAAGSNPGPQHTDEATLPSALSCHTI